MYDQVIQKFNSMPNMLKAKLFSNIVISLFAPYKCKVLFNETEYGIFGYNSLSLARDVRAYSDSKPGECAVRVGNFCEDASHNMILLGGEHQNSKPVNCTFALNRDMTDLAKSAGINTAQFHSYSRGPVVIGSNVTLSMRAIILSGVKIGNGAVLGAGAVVTKDVPPFAIVAGSPAKVIKYRFDEKTIEMLEKIHWWDMNIKNIMHNLDVINSLPSPDALKKLEESNEQNYRQPDNNYLVFVMVRDGNTDGASLNFRGAEVDGKLILAQDLPLEFRFFIDQSNQPPGSVFYLVKDIFKLCGLV